MPCLSEALRLSIQNDLVDNVFVMGGAQVFQVSSVCSKSKIPYKMKINTEYNLEPDHIDRFKNKQI